MKIVLLAAAVLAVSGCGAYQFGGGGASPTPSLGTVSGHVIAVPCAPVEQPGEACTGRPVANVEIDYLQGTTVEARTVTNALTSRPRGAAPFSADVTYDAERAALKIVVVGGAEDSVNLLSLIRLWLDQLRA